MKKLGLTIASALFTISLLSVGSMCAISCEDVDVDADRKDDPVGLWTPMKISETDLLFSANGGQRTISCKNYYWWISAGECNNVFILPKSSDPMRPNRSDLLEADWFKAYAPNYGKSNTLEITVEPNTTGQPRNASITMTAGDVFGYIKIRQN